MICSALKGTYRTPHSWTGLTVGLLLFAVVLPAAAWGQSSVPSLIEQGRAAGVDAELLQTVAARAEAAGFSGQATADLLRPAVTLAERDLPATPLLTKTLEGLAKQVPARRMSPVLQQLQTHTQEAGALVSSWVRQDATQEMLGRSGSPPRPERDQLITTIAEARQQDLPPPALEQFLNQLPEAVQRRPVGLSEVATAVSAMPDLPGARDNPALARELLTAALNAEYDAESLRQLPAALEQARRTSSQPTSAIAKGAARAIAQGTPAANVLRTLFQGTVPGVGPAAGPGNGPPDTPPGQGKPPGADPPNNPGDPPVDPPGGPPSGGGR